MMPVSFNINALTAAGFGDFMQSVWDALSSIYAIIAYVLILFALVAGLIFSLSSKYGTAGVATAAPVPKSDDVQDIKVAATDDRKRFSMLSRIDERGEGVETVGSKITLRELCERFRNYMSYKQKLYYDIADIRRFIAGMAVSKIIILQGISGTGKTSLAYAFGEFIQNEATVIPIQPMWKERTDLIGYYNEFTGRFNETQLLKRIYEANYGKSMYIALLDEVNIARIEYYFAEFLSLLELPDPDKRYLDVVSDIREGDPELLKDGRVKLSDNMWFIGTANNDDTTFAISDKVYDRAMVLSLDKKADMFEAPRTQPIRLTAEGFRALALKAEEEYGVTMRNRRRISMLDKYMIEHFQLTFGNRIRKQIMTYIPVYLACGGEELEALDDILSKKVMRKLEAQNPVYLRGEAEGLINTLDEIFGPDRMPECKDRINRLVRNT
jgi:hypothetical protein